MLSNLWEAYLNLCLVIWQFYPYRGSISYFKCIEMKASLNFKYHLSVCFPSVLVFGNQNMVTWRLQPNWIFTELLFVTQLHNTIIIGLLLTALARVSSLQFLKELQYRDLKINQWLSVLKSWKLDLQKTNHHKTVNNDFCTPNMYNIRSTLVHSN